MAKSFMGIDADYRQWAKRQSIGAQIAMLKTRIANAKLAAKASGKTADAIVAEAQAEIDRLNGLNGKV